MYGLTDPIIGRCYASLAPAFAAREEALRLQTPQTALARAESVKKFFKKNILTSCAFTGVLRTAILEETDFTIEKLCFEDACGCAVPANLYLPRKRDGRVPAVLLPLGHYLEGKANAAYQTMARTFAEMGCAALIFDPPGQGERVLLDDPRKAEEKKDLWCVAQHMHWGDLCYLFGYNFASLMAAESLSAVTYLCEREEIDASRLGAVGQSGGGTAVQYLCALSDALSLAIPIHCTTTCREMLRLHGVGDCEQSFLGFVRQGFDQVDFFLPFMGKDLLILAGSEDYFPLSGAREVQRQLSDCARLLGVREDWARLAVVQGGHVISEEVRRMVYGFVAERFGLTPPAEENDAVRTAGELSALLPGKADENRRALLRKIVGVCPQKRGGGFSQEEQKALEEIFRPAYADRMEPTAEGFLVTGGEATTTTECILYRGTSDRLLVLADSGAWHAKREILELAQGASVLLLHPQGMDVYRESDGEGFDADAEYFYLSVLCGAPIGAQRAAQGVAAARHAGELLSVREIACIGTGSGALTALLCKRLLPGVTSVRAEGGFLDVLAALRGEGTAYRRTDVIPGLLQAVSVEALCGDLALLEGERRHELWSL